MKFQAKRQEVLNKIQSLEELKLDKVNWDILLSKPNFDKFSKDELEAANSFFNDLLRRKEIKSIQWLIDWATNQKNPFA